MLLKMNDNYEGDTDDMNNLNDPIDIPTYGIGKNKLPDSVYSQLEPLVENMIADMAIKTVGIYMSEFRDHASKNWMNSFLDYSNSGFPNNDWRIYLETMIRKDESEIYVYTDPPKAMRKGLSWQKGKGNSGLDGNFKVQYTHTIEPRKFANQIVQVIENIGKEVQTDLHCINNENVEAARFASDWIKDGYDDAVKRRKLTRYVNDVSTPSRDRNFHDFSVLSTNLAIDLTKAELSADTSSSNNVATVKYLDQYVSGLVGNTEQLEPLDRLLQEARGPRTMIEKLYYLGLKESIVEVDGEKVSVLKLAQLLLEKRLIVALAIIRITSTMNSSCRQFYGLIKDCGGFKRFNLKEKKPEFKIVDIDKASKALLNGDKTGALAAVREENQKLLKEVDENLDTINNNIEEAPVLPNQPSFIKDDINVFEPEPSQFGSNGPDLM